MSPARPPKSVPASVRARLLDVARRRNVEFQLVLSEFAIERLLYRLGKSPRAGDFVLRGAMLFKLWPDVRHRATWDLDLLGRGASGVADVAGVIRDLCGVSEGDGIVFDVDSVAGEEIRAADEYTGVRVRLEARLAEARIPVQVDVGFGDAAVPMPTPQTYPTLLDHAAPRILAYARETVVAEKLEAIVSIGVTNSRMKDFYDVHVLATSFGFKGPLLARAVRATFDRRGTPFPESVPVALTREFLAAPERQAQWRAFLRRGRLGAPPDAGELATALRAFLEPVLHAAGSHEAFAGNWRPGGPWAAT
jgi:hypothetical protein